MKIQVKYPKLPTKILTLIVEINDTKYYFAISEYDYHMFFGKKQEKQLYELICNNSSKSTFATIDNPFVIYIIDGKIME